MAGMRWKGLVLVALAGGVVAMTGSMAAPEAPEGWTIVFQDDFEAGLDRWEMTDARAWTLGEDHGGKVLSLTGSSNYQPPVRSPHSMARVKNLKVENFTLNVEARQTGREYGHRDLCFFFGYQDPAHFYYVHIASKADEHANSIFLVNGKPRVSIATERNKGTNWTGGYHKVRITRDVESGAIEVFFDDMEKPIMKARDKTFLSGAVGLGSFDDTGNFDNLQVLVPGKKRAGSEHK